MTLVSTRKRWQEKNKTKKQYCSFRYGTDGYWHVDWRLKTAKPGDYGICIWTAPCSSMMVQCQCFKPRSSGKSGAPGLLRMRGQWIWCDLDLLWLNPLICLGALETITMPLGKWLKDLLVNKRASLEDFRNWRCLLVTLYCSCCTANCKEKNNTYNIPEERERKKKIWTGGTLEHFPWFISYSCPNGISGHF